jgi:hypothetical protein
MHAGRLQLELRWDVAGGGPPGRSGAPTAVYRWVLPGTVSAKG